MSGAHKVLKLQEDSIHLFSLWMGVGQIRRCWWLDVNNPHICFSQKGCGKIQIRS